MQIEDDECDMIYIAAFEVEQLLPYAKNKIQQKAMVDVDYQAICNQIAMGSDTIGKNFQFKHDILCWKNRVNVQKGICSRIMASEHDSKIAGNFRRE